MERNGQEKIQGLEKKPGMEKKSGMEKTPGVETKPGMEKKPRRKLIGGLILLIVLSALYAGCLIVFNLVSSTVNSMSSRAYQMKALSKSTEKAFSMMDSVFQDVIKRHTDKVLLEAAACSTLLEAEPDFQPCMYQDGAIIKVENGIADCPDELLEDIRIDVDQMTGAADMIISFGDGKDRVLSSVYYAQIDGPFYYVEWESYDRMEEEQHELFDSDHAMAGIEKAFHVNLLLFPEESGLEGSIRRSIPLMHLSRLVTWPKTSALPRR